jgi:hypothetical protein
VLAYALGGAGGSTPPAWLSSSRTVTESSASVEGSELVGGQATPGFQLQVTEARLAGKRTRLIRHGSPSSCPGIRGVGREDHKDQSCGSSPYAAGELEALPADPEAAGTTSAYGTDRPQPPRMLAAAEAGADG